MVPSRLTTYLVKRLDSSERRALREEQEVNPLISEVAAWYEKLRNAMEYKEEEVILRAAIERILKRRLIFGRSNAAIAKALVHELIWAKYFPENAISEEKIEELDETISIYLELEREIGKRHKTSKLRVNDWILHLLSSDIEQRLRFSQEKELFCNYIYQLFREKVIIEDQTEQERDIQVFIAVHRVFAKEDLAMLRFALIKQMYGEITRNKIDDIAEEFIEVQKDVDGYLRNPYKDKIATYIKRQIPAFYILEGVFSQKRGNVEKLVEDEDEVSRLVEQECAEKYQLISRKISTAIVRSVAFILLTKAIFALTLETSFERFLYGHVSWLAIGINTLFAPVLMLISSAFIKIPDKENTHMIVKIIKEVLYDETPNLARPLMLNKNKFKVKTPILVSYTILWFLALSIGLFAINWGLNQLHFNPVSKIVFIFFLAVVSFMSYRISQSAKIYTVKKEKQGVRSALFDFFFVPFIQVGKYLTVGVAQINIVLFIFDYIIETPFKEIFAFLEQWLFFLRSQRETLD